MNNPQILLLEDHGMIREAFKALLIKSLPNAVIHEASNFEQAISLLKTHRIKFAFLDFYLADESDKTGLDVLVFIRQHELGTRAIILSGGSSISGYLDRNIILQCLSAGAFGYIPKAIEGPKLFREAFETLLEGRIYLPAAFNEDVELEPQTLDALNINGRLPEVLFYLTQGFSNKTIAEHMQLSIHTVRNYVSDLLKQFKVESRTQLIIAVARLGIVIKNPESIIT